MLTSSYNLHSVTSPRLGIPTTDLKELLVLSEAFYYSPMRLNQQQHHVHRASPLGIQYKTVLFEVEPSWCRPS